MKVELLLDCVYMYNVKKEHDATCTDCSVQCLEHFLSVKLLLHAQTGDIAWSWLKTPHKYIWIHTYEYTWTHNFWVIYDYIGFIRLHRSLIRWHEGNKHEIYHISILFLHMCGPCFAHTFMKQVIVQFLIYSY